MKRTYKQIKEEKNKQTNYREIERTNKWRRKKEERTNEGGKERTNKWRIERTNWQMIEWKCELIERKIVSIAIAIAIAIAIVFLIQELYA